MDPSLIKLVNRLQDAFSTVGVQNPVDLPQIVVVGAQSSGKSSVLENIVGRDFLPRGTGIVTRRPLVLQLIHRPRGGNTADGASLNGSTSPPTSKRADSVDPDEWGEFLHLPGKKFHNFAHIREEIQRDTDLKTGRNAGISPQPINLRIYSHNVLTLTLVDLPGMTKVPVGDQPKDIEKQIREMILRYITKANAIILAVTAANTDLANSDALKLARETDPEGARTIGVLTKVDLMDAGTDVVDILAGRVIPLRLGYVPVVNRGQRDIEMNKSIALALENERMFFDNHPAYKSKAQYCGTPFLARKLNMILMHHIRATLPETKAKITAALQKYQLELAQLGEPVDDHAGMQASLLLSAVTEFCNDFRTVIDGSSEDLSAAELAGGARISFVFHEVFTNGVRVVDPFDQVKDVDIRTILYNSSGSAPALFVATQAFEVIVKQQIKRLEEPSLKCVVLVYDELVRIVQQLLQKQSFRRFPDMRDRFNSCVIALFKKALLPTNKLVQDLISMEMTYINTGHPDFINGHRAMAIVNERVMGGGRANPNNLPGTAQPTKQAAGQIPGTNTPAVPGQAGGMFAKNDVNAFLNEDGGSSGVTGFFGSFFSGSGASKKKKAQQLEPPPPVLKATGNLSEREFMETEVIKILIQSYFNIVKRTITDVIPKAIMLNLVAFSKESLQRELLGELYRPDVMGELLKESEFTVERRKECVKMIEALQRADEIVAGV